MVNIEPDSWLAQDHKCRHTVIMFSRVSLLARCLHDDLARRLGGFCCLCWPTDRPYGGSMCFGIALYEWYSCCWRNGWKHTVFMLGKIVS